MTAGDAITGQGQPRRPRSPLTVREVRGVLQRLSYSSAVDELLAKAAQEARALCGFERAVVLAADQGALTATASGAIEDQACDELRRRALARPMPVVPDSEEARVLRRPTQVPSSSRPASSTMRDVLGLRHELLVPIVLEGRAVALLVLDRTTGEVEDVDRERGETAAHAIEVALERLVLRQRLVNLAGAFRHLTTSAQALAQEAVHGPVALATDSARGLLFDAVPVPQDDGGRATSTLDGLTERERQIAALLVAGRSNREIAGELHLSPETVKGNIAKMLRKLGAGNRVEAVAQLARSFQGTEGRSSPQNSKA